MEKTPKYTEISGNLGDIFKFAVKRRRDANNN